MAHMEAGAVGDGARPIPPAPGALPTPARLLPNVIFTAAATALLALIGRAVADGAIPWIAPGERPLQEGFTGWGAVAFQVWMITAVLLALVLPALALVVWRRQERIRRALLPYLLVLLAQIPTEVLFARLFFANISPVIGLVYTGFRLWQLWWLRRLLTVTHEPTGAVDRTGYAPVRALLVLGLGFWSMNLVFLIVTLATRVIQLG